MREKIFRWNKQIPIALMRIELGGKLYGYSQQRAGEMVFRVVPNGGYQGSGRMLKAYRGKHKWTQLEAGDQLGVSQSAIARYEDGKRIMPLWFAIEIQRLNAGEKSAHPWHKNHRREKIFKWNKGHISAMRIEVFDNLYAYDYHKDDEMFFKAIPKIRDQGRGELLKVFRAKHHLTQAELGKPFDVSQTLIALYEAGKRPVPRNIVQTIRHMNNGLTAAQVKQLHGLRK